VQRSEAHLARLKVSQAEYDVRLKKAEYIPDFSVVLNYLSPVTSDSLPRHIAYIGLEFSWDFYDWGRKQAEITERRKTLEQARNDLQHAEPQILLDVNTRFRTLQERRALLRVQQLAQEATQEKLRVMTQKYRQQAVLLQDVLQAQTTVADTTHQYQ
jgi:outer membrane protein TolC